MRHRSLVCGALVAVMGIAGGGSAAFSQTTPGHLPVPVSITGVTINADGSATVALEAIGCGAFPPGHVGFVIDVPGFDGPIALGTFPTDGEGTAVISAADLANPAYQRTFTAVVACNDQLEGSVTFTIAEAAVPVSASPTFTG